MRPNSVPLARLGRLLPGAALGRYLARVAGEGLGLPGVWAALLLGAALAAGGAMLLARWPLGRTWPALLLLAYVVWPEVSPTTRLWVAAVAGAALLVAAATRRSDSPDTAGRRDRWLTWAVGLALFVGALAVYGATLAPDVLPADSGELQVVAAQLGVAHPPGFPLYVLLAHLFTRLPVGSPAYGVNLLSAVCAALTLVVVYGAGRLLTGRQLPALVGALALGTATTFWSQATTANVRSLTGLLAALALYALLRFRIATRAGERLGSDDATKPQLAASRRAADRWLTLAALFLGLGLTHHVSLAFLAAVALVFVLVTDPSLLRSPRRWWPPLAAALLGLLPLLYLPLRAGADVRGASPDLATLSGFLEHVLATGFRGDLFYYLAPADLGQRLLVMGNVMTFQFAPLLLAGMALGLLLLLWRDRPLALLLGGTFAVYLFVTATYRAPQTVEYMLPTYVPAALALAYAIGYLPAALAGRPWAGAAGALFAALMLVAALGQLPGHVSAAGARHEAGDARAVAGRLLADAPPGSTILAHWHWATPLWYLREVEGQRPDVDVRFVFPEGESYDATWARRTAEAFAEGRPVITTWVPPAPLADLHPPEPLGEALLYPPQPRLALPAGYGALDVALGDAIELLGYRLEEPGDGVLVPGEEAVVTIAWRPAGELPADLSLFAHVVGADGALVAQDDRPARAAEGLTLTQFRLTPRPGPAEGEVSLVIGLGSGARQEIVRLPLGRSQRRPLTRHPVWRRLTGAPGDTLIGYDWDHTVAGRVRLYLHWAGDDGHRTQIVDDAAIDGLALPPYRGPWGVPVRRWRFPRGQEGGHYVPLGQGIVWTGDALDGLTLAPGEAAVLRQRFGSGRPVNRDLVVSVRLIGLEPDGFHWAWWDLRDSVPAMGAIPTLKWVAGSAVRSPHRVVAAADAPPGQALTGALTLYDAFTNRPLPILDERITAQQPWIPLGAGVVGE